MSFISKDLDSSKGKKKMGLLNKHERLVFSGTRFNPKRTFPSSGDDGKAQCLRALGSNHTSYVWILVMVG